MSHRVSFVAAVNDRAVLASCLGQSPDLGDGANLVISEGYSSAAAALNAGLDRSVGDYVVFVHQDVYLPAGWLNRLIESIDDLDAQGARWAVLGTVGLDKNGGLAGCTWSTDVWREYGQSGRGPMQVVALDECVLVLRRASGLRFDPLLPSFHLYAADLILSAERLGLEAYAIDAPVVHHSLPVRTLLGGYQDAYRFMQKKWWDLLPIETMIVPLSKGSYSLFRGEVRRLRQRLLRALTRGRSGSSNRTRLDPKAIAIKLGYE